MPPAAAGEIAGDRRRRRPGFRVGGGETIAACLFAPLGPDAGQLADLDLQRRRAPGRHLTDVGGRFEHLERGHVPLYGRWGWDRPSNRTARRPRNGLRNLSATVAVPLPRSRTVHRSRLRRLDFREVHGGGQLDAKGVGGAGIHVQVQRGPPSEVRPARSGRSGGCLASTSGARLPPAKRSEITQRQQAVAIRGDVE